MDETVARHFASRMREARLAKGWSQENLARRMAMSKNAVIEIEKGRQEPRLGTIVAMAKALEVEPGWLLGGPPNRH